MLREVFPCLEAAPCGRQSGHPAVDLSAAWRSEIEFLTFPSFCWISTEQTFKFHKKTPVYKLPRGAIYKPPCVQLLNNPALAIHQVFALSNIVFAPLPQYPKHLLRPFVALKLFFSEIILKILQKTPVFMS